MFALLDSAGYTIHPLAYLTLLRLNSALFS